MTEKRCRHNLVICSQCVRITDAAKRMSDMINGCITFYGAWEIRNKWMAFALQDGRSDGVLYDTKQAAVKHVSNENYYAFFCFRGALGGSNPKDCQLFLDINRHAYEHGNRLADPDDRTGGGDLIVSTHAYDVMMPKPVELLVPTRAQLHEIISESMLGYYGRRYGRMPR